MNRKDPADHVGTTRELVVESRDGTKLSATCVGSGSPVVLVHGALLAKEAWQFVAPLLAERHMVWTYDRRGHGGTGGGADASPARDVEDLAAVVAAAGGEVHLVGHSAGAVVCLDAARDVEAAREWGVRSLVVYEPPVHFHRVADQFRRCLDLLRANDLEGFLDVFLAEAAAASDEEIAVLRSIPETWTALLAGARSYATHHDALARILEEALASGWRPDSYRSVAVPTLVVAGALTESGFFATTDELREAIPHAEVVTLAGQRHLGPAFDPAGFAHAVLAFTTAHG